MTTSLLRIASGAVTAKWPTLRPRLSRYKWLAISLTYVGRRFSCPVCGGHYRKMRPQYEKFSILGEVVWDGFTENNTCPRCHTVTRLRFMMAFLRTKTNLFEDALTVLHFAPEQSLTRVLRKARNLTYIPADLEPLQAETRQMDITAIPLADASVDVVLCSNVLEHVEEDAVAMSEIYRVLKPGGWSMVAVPTFTEKSHEDSSVRDEEERLRMFGSKVHVRLYGPDIVDRLTTAGFAVETHTFDNVPGNYLDRSVWTPVRQSEQYLFLCRKQMKQEEG